jgi:hypothetical protein
LIHWKESPLASSENFKNNDVLLDGRTTMRTATTTSFDISNVQRATEPLPEVPYKEAVEAQITPGPVDACSRYHGRLLERVAYHPVVAAVHRAFMGHRPLCLSPDMIWLMIIQGVANHINAHAEELRPRIVSHQGKLTIRVRRDDFVKGSPENPWSEVFNEFSVQIGDHVGASIELFVPSFSTTGHVERAAAEVVLFDAMQSYFEYVVHTLCGIPTIALEGTYEDWKALAERVQGFREFGLGLWLDVLSPILNQFARASQGDVDPAFWRSLYKFQSISGGAVINGWITAFFPYKKDLRTGRASVPLGVLFRNEKDMLERMLYPGEEPHWETPGFTVGSFPSGLSKAPFRWDYLDRSFDMEFLGGFVGVAQDQETLALRPEIGWAVREAPATG